MRKLNLSEKSKVYLWYTALFCLICLIVFSTFIKLNKGFIWQDDGFKQHYEILYDFNQMMRNLFQKGFPMFSWEMGLGLDVIGQYSYYVLGDPFAYLSLLFPISSLETMYSVLVILRIFCVGLAFIYYCQYQKKENWPTLIGSILYTFCGFILYAGIRHPYFTNAAILLPLNFVGIEKLLRENKKTFLIFMVGISAISNYYFFYMITIITFLYALVKYIVEYNEGIKVFFKRVLTAIGCYVIGVLIASIMLLPTIYAFFNSARTSYEQTYSYSPDFYLDFFRGIICMRYSNWTVVSVSSIILLMLPVLFTKIKEKEARTFAILFVITTIMLIFPLVASIMNGLSFPNNRWVFAYSFILSYIVTITFKKDLQYSTGQMILMLVVLAIYSMIGWSLTKSNLIGNLDFWVAIAIAGIIWLVFIIANVPKMPKIIKKFSPIMAILLIIGNLGVISFALYAKIGKIGKNYASEFKTNNSVNTLNATLSGKADSFKEAIEYIKEKDTGFYRIAKYDTGHHNISLLYDYHSIQTFLSIGNEYVYQLSSSLEDNHYVTTRCVNGMNRRTKIMTLLGVKYYICSEKEAFSVPYGYSLYHQIGNTQIYQNQNALSLGVFYDSYTLQEEYDKLSPLEKEDMLLTTAVIEEKIEKVKKQENILGKIAKINQLNYIEKENLIKENEIEVTKENQKISLQIENLKENAEVYLWIKNLKYNSGTNKTAFKVTTSFNGLQGEEEVQDRLSSAYYVKNPDFLINLGVTSLKTKETLEITFHNKGTYTFDALEILEVSMEMYESKAKRLQQNEMTNVKYGSNFIQGNVKNETAGILQMTTSYSDGWKAFVNGKETEILKVNEGFVGILLEAGEHVISFQYETPYLKIGMAFSMIGVVSFIGIILIEYRNRRKILVKKK